VAGSQHDILITIDEEYGDYVASADLERVARAALEGENVPSAELGILITSDAIIHDLNRRYADEDKATDVLSFSLREGEEFVSPDDIVRLGEVIISLDTAKRQAEEAGRALEAEVAHLLVHGILHLLGYDHAEAEEERAMRGREEAILGPGTGTSH
jgi:probable rRNA maturation factor